MKNMIDTFELVGRLNPNSKILLMNVNGDVIDYNSKAYEILKNQDDKLIINIDDNDKFKQYLSRCSKNLNLLKGVVVINDKKYHTEGCIFSHGDNTAHIVSVIVFLSENSKLSSNFRQLNKITDLSYEIGKHRALEKKLREQSAEIEKLINYDFLTNLFSKNFFEKLVTSSIKKAQLQNSKLFLIFCDLDKFKAVNDTFGHHTGDLLLKHIADEINKILPKNSFASRFGGDEFVILMDTQTSTTLNLFIDKMQNIFSKPIKINGCNTHTSLSMGISIFPENGHTYEELAKHADLALYDAKKISGSSFSFFSDKLKETYLRFNQIDTSLREAIRKNELYVHYQPQYCLKTMKITGLEALCRWKDSVLGMVSPAEFIPIAENAGIIKELTRSVFDKSLKEFKSCQEKYGNLFEDLKLSLNVSAEYMNDMESFVELVKQTKDSGVASKNICFEITETTLMHYRNTAIELLTSSSKEGYSSAIDDFGVGYSSLGYLKDLPANVLKIDASFIKNIDKDERNLVITKAIVKMGSTLGLEVVAEGAETEAQIDILKDIKCDTVQGFYFAKPMIMDGVIELLKKEQ